MTIREAIAARPSATDPGARYGRFRYQENPRERGQIIIEPSWVRQNIVAVPTSKMPGFPSYPGPKGPLPVRQVWLHRLVVDPLLETWAELDRRGLTGALRTFNGAWMPRHMLHDPSEPLSMHAWGCAVDWDAQWNGYGLPADRIALNREVARVFEEFGWSWGGRWNPTDGMHVQFTDLPPGVSAPAWQDAAGAVNVPFRVFLDGADVTGTRVEAPDLVVNAVKPGVTYVRVPGAAFPKGFRPTLPDGGHMVFVNDLCADGQRVELGGVVVNATGPDKIYIARKGTR